MIVLSPAGYIAGGASSATKLTYHIFGMELNGTTKTYKELCTGQLGAFPATLYTAGGGVTAFISSIVVVNTDTTSAYTFQFFTNGTASVNALTSIINLGAGLQSTFEDGQNGWSVNQIIPGTTLLNDIHSGYSDYTAIANPSMPGADTIRLYARKMAGRLLPKWIPSSGVDNPVQPALFGNNIITYIPSSSTNGGTATLGGWGQSWTAGGTVSHPTPAAGIINQMRRTRYANVVTTTNQTLGIMSTASGLPSFWRGNGTEQGGFFFFCRYTIELWAANTCRIFVGLSDSTTAQVTLESGSFTGNLCAFVHDAADGANVLWFITRDGATVHKTTINGATIAAGQGFDFYMYCKPNDSRVYYRVDSINSATILADTYEENNLPTNTVFMGPQIHMSNGTANTVVTTVAPGINKVYIESDY